MTDLISILGLLLALLGIPSVGAILDTAVPARLKRKTARWSRTQSRRLIAAQFGGSGFFESIFGSRVISWRAFSTTAFLTVTSSVIGFGIAYFTTDPTMRKEFLPIQSGRVDIISIYTILIFTIAIVSSDFLSYAQTRVFVSALDRIRNFPVAILLYFADLALSIAIFCIGFAIAKTIVTLLSINMLYREPLPRESAVSPEFIISSYSNLDPKFSLPRIRALDLALSTYNNDQSKISEEALDMRVAEVEYEYSPNIVKSIVFKRINCITDLSLEAEPKTHIYEIAQQSARAASALVGFNDVTFTFGGSAPFSSSLHRVVQGCPIHVVAFSSNISVAEQVKDLQLVDFFLASTERTSEYISTSILTKFDAFQYDEPVSDSVVVAEKAMVASRSVWLGLGRERRKQSWGIYFGKLPVGHIRIPFSSLAASSLAANIMFGGYLLLSLGTWVGRAAIRFPLIRSSIKPSWIFFRLSLGCSFVLGAALTVSLAAHWLSAALLHLVLLRPVV